MTAVSGLDSNVLCCLGPSYPEQVGLRQFLPELGQESRIALIPSVVHEAYHALVLSQKWSPSEARRPLQTVLAHPYVEFVNQAKRVTEVSLRLAAERGMGGETR
ncbi:MAG: hypothetical protein QXX77_06975 [Candidatus Methanosuratincola sp.]